MSLFTRTDVTAVKLLHNFIVAGIGSSISIYSKDSLKFLGKMSCLRGQKIYGIVPSSNSCKLLIFGGKQCTVLSLTSTVENKNCVKVDRLFAPIECDDWLHSGVWMNMDTVGLLTAHNTVQIWDISKQIIILQHPSKENSILYSGLLLPLKDNLLVFAGTVFSEVIIHIPNEDKALHYLKGHRGVIFSIACSLNKGIIVTTSDDRSVRIWKMNSSSQLAPDTIDYWRSATIDCIHEVYGHTARVMRSCIIDDMVISVGEDSAICFWNFEGKLLRKNMSHQNGCIWSVDAQNKHLVTGGGDTAVVLHPVSMATKYGDNEVLNLGVTPKKIAFTARRNLIILDDTDLIHYDIVDKVKNTHKLNHESTYKMISLSSCKQMIAVADMTGNLDIFVESCKDKACIINIVDTKLNFGKLLSMHWAGNRHLIFCADKGNITVLSSSNVNIEEYANFVLPSCKERWLTAVAMDPAKRILIVGDRCGNIHVFVKGNTNPVKTFNKVHGRYGPTSINIKNGEFISTGRDGSIKYFSLNAEDIFLAKYMNSKDLEFQWVEKFIDKDENIICGFLERIFVIYNVKENLKLLDVPCGGGHRSWDVIRCIDKVGDQYDEIIKLIYIKNSDIHCHTFQMSGIVSRNVINSSHSKEINCMKTYQSTLDESITFYVTGGEDTSLRISSVDSDLKFQDEVVFKQLSNVRTLKTVKIQEGLLIISAGGRAQICIKLINHSYVDKKLKISSYELIDYLIKGTDKERKNNQTWRNCSIDFDPETRIMDVEVLKEDNNKITIFAGCSDACLRTFIFDHNSLKFSPKQELKFHKTCILKTMHTKFLNKDILITCTTRGEISLWNFSDVISAAELKPFFTITSNRSGINSIDTKAISDNELLIATGGDDNAIHLNVIEVLNEDLSTTYVKYKWCTDRYHCSQITGLKFVDEFLVSTSIDQRITLSRWRLQDDGVKCEFLSQEYSDVADIQGLEVLASNSASITVCVFGKGMEVLRLSTCRQH